MISNNNLPKFCPKFYCEICDYGTCKKSSYDEPQEIVEEFKSLGGFIVHEYCYECYDKLIDED